MNDIEILNPIKELKIGDEIITISELAWPDALTFVRKISEHAGKFVASDGSLSFSLDRLSEMISGTQELSEWLIFKASGKDLEWLSRKTFSEGLDLLDAALSQNLRPDFFERLKRIQLRFNGTIKLPSGQPSTSSSGKDTPQNP